MTGSVIVLLIEDEPLILLAAETVLQDGGYTCLTGTDGVGGMKLIMAHIEEATALITDIRMDGPNGWELARYAREVKPSIPVIYTTGDSGADWPSEGVPKSIVLQKPYAAAQLLTAVSQLINAATGDQLVSRS